MILASLAFEFAWLLVSRLFSSGLVQLLTVGALQSHRFLSSFTWFLNILMISVPVSMLFGTCVFELMPRRFRHWLAWNFVGIKFKFFENFETIFTSIIRSCRENIEVQNISCNLCTVFSICIAVCTGWPSLSLRPIDGLSISIINLYFWHNKTSILLSVINDICRLSEI